MAEVPYELSGSTGAELEEADSGGLRRPGGALPQLGELGVVQEQAQVEALQTQAEFGEPQRRGRGGRWQEVPTREVCPPVGTWSSQIPYRRKLLRWSRIRIVGVHPPPKPLEATPPSWCQAWRT